MPKKVPARAKRIAFANPEIDAKITKLVNEKRWPLSRFDIRDLAKQIQRVLEPVYVGPTKGVYLQGDAISRLTAKEDAHALAALVGRTHKHKHPHLYNK
ncbi:MAG TPA: hypothetical protein DD671_01845 [Balneolaceae bacterium]|nr:hypothetical protein [Balneolaceae bacterium]